MIFICTSFCQAAASQFSGEHHYISLSANMGYPYLLANSNRLQAGFSIAPALGVGYRFSNDGFLIQVGIEGEFNYLTNHIKDSQLSVDMTDTENDNFIMHVSAKNGKDYIQLANCYVPIYIGFEHRYFYLLAGAKVGINLYGTTYTTSTISTRAEYERYIGWMENMPNHDLENNVTIRSNRSKLSINSPSVMVHLEIGGQLDQKKRRINLAVFADYGVMNMHKNISQGDDISYTQNQNQALQFQATPFMISNQMLDKQVHPFTIGVKFTYLFKLRGKPICVMCRD